jgi:iron complex outermembrane receptor protein
MKRRILPSVTVLVKGTKKAQQQISMGVIPSMLKGDVLQFSYVGLETKSVTVTGTTLNVTLTEVEKRYKMLSWFPESPEQ